jgi:hypothetical protein
MTNHRAHRAGMHGASRRNAVRWLRKQNAEVCERMKPDGGTVLPVSTNLVILMAGYFMHCRSGEARRTTNEKAGKVEGGEGYRLNGGADFGAAITERNQQVANELSVALRKAGYTHAVLVLVAGESVELSSQQHRGTLVRTSLAAQSFT